MSQTAKIAITVKNKANKASSIEIPRLNISLIFKGLSKSNYLIGYVL